MEVSGHRVRGLSDDAKWMSLSVEDKVSEGKEIIRTEEELKVLEGLGQEE